MKDISLHLLDIVNNSVEAGSTAIHVRCWDYENSGTTGFSVSDNGKGMSDEMIEKATDPFFTTRTTRKVGLGLSLLKQNTEHTGGIFTLTSQLGKGTILKAEFIRDHPDTPPKGNIASVWTQLITSQPCIMFYFTMSTNKDEYSISTKEIMEVLDGVSIQDLSVRKMILELINENIKEL